jgi:hypothetical protein
MTRFGVYALGQGVLLGCAGLLLYNAMRNQTR